MRGSSKREKVGADLVFVATPGRAAVPSAGGGIYDLMVARQLKFKIQILRSPFIPMKGALRSIKGLPCRLGLSQADI